MQLFSCSDKQRMLFFMLITVKMPTIVGILTFMSWKNSMLNWDEHEKSFITSGPDISEYALFVFKEYTWNQFSMCFKLYYLKLLISQRSRKIYFEISVVGMDFD